jgi:hypothetical protein
VADRLESASQKGGKAAVEKELEKLAKEMSKGKFKP